jgi:hypothetical protein
MNIDPIRTLAIGQPVLAREGGRFEESLGRSKRFSSVDYWDLFEKFSGSNEIHKVFQKRMIGYNGNKGLERDGIPRIPYG